MKALMLISGVIVVLLFMILLSARSSGISTFYDEERDVTCWILKDPYYVSYGGISCLPNYQLSSYEEEEPDYRYDLYHCSRTSEGCEPLPTGE